jgi:hypothetical protein
MPSSTPGSKTAFEFARLPGEFATVGKLTCRRNRKRRWKLRLKRN